MNIKKKLSLLWLFAVLNYLYCDIITLMDSSVLSELLNGSAGELQLTQNFLLAASIMIEIPIAMVILSLFLKDKFSRWANIIAGIIMTAVQALSLFVGTIASYYIFFSIIEIATTIFIVRIAWKWKLQQN